jgi:hypothetical protein
VGYEIVWCLMRTWTTVEDMMAMVVWFLKEVIRLKTLCSDQVSEEGIVW